MLFKLCSCQRRFEQVSAASSRCWLGVEAKTPLTLPTIPPKRHHRPSPGFVRGFAFVRKNNKSGTFGAL